MLFWVCCHALMCVLVLQLLLVFKDYNIVTTVTYNKFSLESEDGELELLCPKLSLFVFLLDVANIDLDKEEENNIKVVQIASLTTLWSQDLALVGPRSFTKVRISVQFYSA